MNDANRPVEIAVKALSGPLLGQSWNVRPDRPAVFGRRVEPSPHELAVVVPDKRISARHLKIEIAPGGPRAFDLDSVNGVRLNGRRIPKGESRPLQDGDVVVMAKSVLEVCFEAERASTLMPTEDTVADSDSSPGLEIPLNLLPYPVAAAIHGVQQAMGPLETVHEIIGSFELILRFQTLVSLSEYQAGARSHRDVARLLDSFCERPFSLGRWFELHNALTRALRGDGSLVVTELATWNDDEGGPRRWRANAARLIEQRNTLLHREGLGAATAEAVVGEMEELFRRLVSSWGFWAGYEVVAVEPGIWSDERGVFQYPCRSLLGCTLPFNARDLRCSKALPPRIPIVISRNGKRRLSLAPFQMMMPVEKKHLRWCLLSECTRSRTLFVTPPAIIVDASEPAGAIRKLLRGQGPPSRARAGFSGKLS